MIPLRLLQCLCAAYKMQNIIKQQLIQLHRRTATMEVLYISCCCCSQRTTIRVLYLCCCSSYTTIKVLVCCTNLTYGINDCLELTLKLDIVNSYQNKQTTKERWMVLSSMTISARWAIQVVSSLSFSLIKIVLESLSL